MSDYKELQDAVRLEESRTNQVTAKVRLKQQAVMAIAGLSGLGMIVFDSYAVKAVALTLGLSAIAGMAAKENK